MLVYWISRMESGTYLVTTKCWKIGNKHAVLSQPTHFPSILVVMTPYLFNPPLSPTDEQDYTMPHTPCLENKYNIFSTENPNIPPKLDLVSRTRKIFFHLQMLPLALNLKINIFVRVCVHKRWEGGCTLSQSVWGTGVCSTRYPTLATQHTVYSYYWY